MRDPVPATRGYPADATITMEYLAQNRRPPPARAFAYRHDGLHADLLFPTVTPTASGVALDPAGAWRIGDCRTGVIQNGGARAIKVLSLRHTRDIVVQEIEVMRALASREGHTRSSRRTGTASTSTSRWSASAPICSTRSRRARATAPRRARRVAALPVATRADEALSLRLFASLVEAVAAMHALGVAHLDLSCENVCLGATSARRRAAAAPSD